MSVSQFFAGLLSVTFTLLAPARNRRGQRLSEQLSGRVAAGALRKDGLII